MANFASSKKRVRQIKRRSAVNRARLTRVRTLLRRAEDAITSGDQVQAEAAFRAAEPELRRGVGKGVVRANAASRKISRLNARLKSLRG